MNRQTRTLVVLLIALGAASAASWGVYRAISQIPVREVEVATHHAVVAAAPLPMGTLITQDNVRLVPWPARAPITGGFDTVDAVVDRGLVAFVAENEPLTENKLAPREAGAGLSPSIPAGMRAMSVKVDEVIGVAGFVVPGTRVDVLVTLQQENENTRSQVVLSNIQVLSAGTRYDQENARTEGQPIPSTVVTLLVTPEDAERIALAQSEGQIMLALRNPLDTEPTDTDGIRLAGLFGDPPPPPPARPAPRAAPRPPPPAAPAPVSHIYTVEAIRAAKRSDETVR